MNTINHTINTMNDLGSATRRAVCMALALMIVVAGFGAGSVGADAAYRAAQAQTVVQFG